MDNNKKLESNQTNNNLHKMSKKRRLKIDKIQKDETLTEQEKRALIDQIKEEENGSKRQKRSQREDFKDQKNFIETSREKQYDVSDGKANKSSLWGEDEKMFLEDVTLNLAPDDEAAQQLKGKNAMKWDSKKKRYILKKVDRDGRIIKEKRNEAGVKITNKNADKTRESIYKKWMKKTHMKLQNVGEIENKKAID